MILYNSIGSYFVISSNHNLIGGANVSGGQNFGNLISGNTTGQGILVGDGTGNSICGNWIGLTADGLTPLPNIMASARSLLRTAPATRRVFAVAFQPAATRRGDKFFTSCLINIVRR